MKSPCIKVCKLDAMGRYCIGCGRTIDQIRNYYLDGLKNGTHTLHATQKKKKT
jgi:predicted Fe-S protein YdhL (DUF1289 family)